MTLVRQLLERKPAALFSVEPETPVLEAIRAMAEHRVGALLVMADRRLVGIVSERDYARKVILLGRASHDTPVADIMSTPVITVQQHDTVQTCMQIMTDRHVRHLPVIDGDKVLGMVSIGDLVKAVIAEQQQQIEQLESYIHS
jgi:CBS domain-containing protein